MTSTHSPTGIERFIKPHLTTFTGYAPPKPATTKKGKTEAPVRPMIKLNANENPYGCSPRVMQALATCNSLNRYPDANQTELRHYLEEYTGVGAEHIVATCGGGEVIDLVLELFVNPGDEVINCEPTFDYFRFKAQVCGNISKEVLRDKNFAISVNAVKAAISERTKLIIINTPNNPTGNTTPQKWR